MSLKGLENKAQLSRYLWEHLVGEGPSCFQHRKGFFNTEGTCTSKCVYIQHSVSLHCRVYSWYITLCNQKSASKDSLQHLQQGRCFIAIPWWAKPQPSHFQEASLPILTGNCGPCFAPVYSYCTQRVSRSGPASASISTHLPHSLKKPLLFQDPAGSVKKCRDPRTRSNSATQDSPTRLWHIFKDLKSVIPCYMHNKENKRRNSS